MMTLCINGKSFDAVKRHQPSGVPHTSSLNCAAAQDPPFPPTWSSFSSGGHEATSKLRTPTDTSGIDMGIKYIASHCPSLRELSISDCVQITDFGLYELAKLGPNLRYLSVAKCDQISDSGIMQIAKLCYKLRYLNVRGCEAVSDDSVEALSRSCTRLRSLDLGKCDVTDVGLKLLAENCPGLKKLSVKSCEMISDQGLQNIAYRCRGLQQLNIQDSPITIDGYRMVKKFCSKCIIEHTNPGFY